MLLANMHVISTGAILNLRHSGIPMRHTVILKDNQKMHICIYTSVYKLLG